ncbi:MAG: hypothetical protein ACO1SV_00760 [Fimbriimonas sp.]
MPIGTYPTNGHRPEEKFPFVLDKPASKPSREAPVMDPDDVEEMYFAEKSRERAKEDAREAKRAREQAFRQQALGLILEELLRKFGI